LNSPSASLQAVSTEAAKTQAESWLKKASPSYDAAAFAKIWADDEASVLDRTLATLEMGSADAKKSSPTPATRTGKPRRPSPPC